MQTSRFFVCLTSKFQAMIANGGTVNCLGKCHSIKSTLRDYFLDNPMISIQMGSIDEVLGVQWLKSLREMTMNFEKYFMRFFLEGKVSEHRVM